MPQPPLRVDQLEIVGDSGVVPTALLTTNATTGELVLSDAVTSARRLADIVGIQGITGVIVCGKGGSGISTDALGNPITTVQQAIDAVPTSATASSPWLVLVMPGVYIENVFHDRDGVHLFGLGNVVIRNAAATDTYTIVEGPFSVPSKLTFQNIRFENTAAAGACVRLTSALYATGTITVSDVTFVGDTVSIAGITLTAIATGSTPAVGEFEIGATFADTATNLVTAINDPINTPLDTTVAAFAAAAVVTVQAQTPGLVGNAITLATSVPLTFVLSGAALAGGVDTVAGSTLVDALCSFIDCDMVATNATGFALRAESVNNLYVEGGNWTEGAVTAEVQVLECASYEQANTSNVGTVDLRYDSVGGGPLPSIATSIYTLRNVSFGGSLVGAFDGGTGSLTVDGSTIAGAITFTSTGGESFNASGTRCFDVTLAGTGSASLANVSSSGVFACSSGSCEFQNCAASTLTLTGTAVCVSRNSRFAAITPSGPGPTLDLDELQIPAVFAAVPSVVVPLPVEQPDALYHVYLDSPLVPAVIGDVPAVPVRGVGSFTVAFGAAQALTVGATVRRFP